jgi:hypothetical protein
LKILVKIESVATLRKPCKTSCLLPNKTQKRLLHFESTRNTNDSKRPEKLKTTNVCFHNKTDMSWLQNDKQFFTKVISNYNKNLRNIFRNNVTKSGQTTLFSGDWFATKIVKNSYKNRKQLQQNLHNNYYNNITKTG